MKVLAGYRTYGACAIGVALIVLAHYRIIPLAADVVKELTGLLLFVALTFLRAAVPPKDSPDSQLDISRPPLTSPKTLLSFAALLLLLVVPSLQAQQRGTSPGGNAEGRMQKAETGQRLSLSAIGESRTTDFHKFKNSLGARLSYELSPRWGLDFDATGSDTHGTLIEHAGGSLRRSFGSGRLRPYISTGAGSKLPSGEITYHAGLGLNACLSPRLGAFLETKAERGWHTSPTSGLGLVGLRWKF